ncbi:MAG: hypothetical protein GTN78_00595 [Gemmatimonadales bacterium]|nr:hypothetical protein [Gemmatimonadales bacterium]NIN10037.1 hypothetical protein [Gemmatimonadales bacterium]NIQ98690.1 hypothetical protein [Gemmatimonadales bacterium]NIS63566.1 hypothetical protein [Gemmatimonadales bacterium]
MTVGSVMNATMRAGGSRVHPGEHAGGRVAIEQFAPHEQLEHRAAERLGEGRDVVQRQAGERAVLDPDPRARVKAEHAAWQRYALREGLIAEDMIRN